MPVRKFKKSDAEACSAIICEDIKRNKHIQEDSKNKIYRESTPSQLIKRMKSFNYLVYQKNRKILGIGGLHGKEARTMYTHPNYQGKGIGSQILKKIEIMAKKKGIKKLFLYTHTKPSKFYLKNKWKTIKKYTNNKGKTVFYMEKILNATTKDKISHYNTFAISTVLVPYAISLAGFVIIMYLYEKRKPIREKYVDEAIKLLQKWR
jgi:N-acetylglutamate synthase-like GNAT family acetyltransferase